MPGYDAWGAAGGASAGTKGVCESPPVVGAAGAAAAFAASTPSESAMAHQSSEPVTTGAGGATEGVYESPPVSDADDADDADADAAGADAAGALYVVSPPPAEDE